MLFGSSLSRGPCCLEAVDASEKGESKQGRIDFKPLLVVMITKVCN